MTSQEIKKGLPTWAKVLIVLAVVGIVGMIAAGVGIFFLVKDMVVQEPADIKRLAAQTMTLEEPLPSGYTMNMGLNMFGLSALTVTHDGDQQMIMLISFPKAETDPQATLKRISEQGIETGSGRIVAQDVKQRGTEEVGGEAMNYLVGTMSDKSGPHDGMVGLIVPKGKQKTIFIYAAQLNKMPYDFAVTQKFLKAIKSFN